MKLALACEHDTEATTEVYLDHSGDHISLMTKDGWYILSLKSDGTLTRHILLPDDIGIKVDKDGRIKLNNDA